MKIAEAVDEVESQVGPDQNEQLEEGLWDFPNRERQQQFFPAVCIAAYPGAT